MINEHAHFDTFMRRIRKVHFVGIGGAGMSGIADVMNTLGYDVSGTDLSDNVSTKNLQKAGVKVYQGHDPAYVKARYNLSLTFMDAKKYEEAVDSFKNLAVLEGDSYRAYYSMGLSYYYPGLHDEALEAYDMALEQKETVNVLNNIGLVYDAMGNKKKELN